MSAAPSAAATRSATAPIISLRALNKTFAGGVTAVDNVDLDIYQGELSDLIVYQFLCGSPTNSASSSGDERDFIFNLHSDWNFVTIERRYYKVNFVRRNNGVEQLIRLRRPGSAEFIAIPNSLRIVGYQKRGFVLLAI